MKLARVGEKLVMTYEVTRENVRDFAENATNNEVEITDEIVEDLFNQLEGEDFSQEESEFDETITGLVESILENRGIK